MPSLILHHRCPPVLGTNFFHLFYQDMLSVLSFAHPLSKEVSIALFSTWKENGRLGSQRARTRREGPVTQGSLLWILFSSLFAWLIITYPSRLIFYIDEGMTSISPSTTLPSYHGQFFLYLVLPMCTSLLPCFAQRSSVSTHLVTSLLI